MCSAANARLGQIEQRQKARRHALLQADVRVARHEDERPEASQRGHVLALVDGQQGPPCLAVEELAVEKIEDRPRVRRHLFARCGRECGLHSLRPGLRVRLLLPVEVVASKLHENHNDDDDYERHHWRDEEVFFAERSHPRR